MGTTLIAVNNFLVRLRHKRVRPERLLLLVSSCLQRSDCQCKLTPELEHCLDCGQCIVCKLRALAAQTGINVFMATGGRLAAQRARDKDIDAVVAVACHKELNEGIKVTFPKPVLAVELGTPCGPCKDTVADIEAVQQAVKFFLR